MKKDSINKLGYQDKYTPEDPNLMSPPTQNAIDPRNMSGGSTGGYNIFTPGWSTRDPGARLQRESGWVDQPFQWQGQSDQDLFDNRHQYANQTGSPEWKRLIQMSRAGGGEFLGQQYARQQNFVGPQDTGLNAAANMPPPPSQYTGGPPSAQDPNNPNGQDHTVTIQVEQMPAPPQNAAQQGGMQGQYNQQMPAPPNWMWSQPRGYGQ